MVADPGAYSSIIVVETTETLTNLSGKVYASDGTLYYNIGSFSVTSTGYSNEFLWRGETTEAEGYYAVLTADEFTEDITVAVWSSGYYEDAVTFTVEYSSHPYTQTYSFGAGDVIVWTAEADGYETQTGTLTLTSGSQTVTVTMVESSTATGYTMTNLEVVGSPTFDSTTGTLSGFSASDYVYTSTTLNDCNYKNIRLNFTYKASSSTQILFKDGEATNPSTYPSAYIDASGNLATATDYGHVKIVTSFSFEDGKTYWLCYNDYCGGELPAGAYCIEDDGTYTVDTLPDAIYQENSNINYESPPYDSVSIHLGYSPYLNTIGAFQGTLNLTKCKLTTYAYTGAGEYSRSTDYYFVE